MVSFAWIIKFVISILLDVFDLLFALGSTFISLTGVGLPFVFTSSLAFNIFYLLVGTVFFGKTGFFSGLIEFIPIIGAWYPSLTIAALIAPKY